jgi:phosphohistidine swiveling domain-containing protein
METLIKALRHFETLMEQSRETLETMARYAQEVRPGTPLDPESWQKISGYVADRIRELVDGLREIAPDACAAFTQIADRETLILPKSSREQKDQACLAENTPLLLVEGSRAAGGFASGRVFLWEAQKDLTGVPTGCVLVASKASPALMAVIHKAAALILEVGTASGNLAILAREYRIPALVNTHQATRVLISGQEVTVDADRGRVSQGCLDQRPKP